MAKTTAQRQATYRARRDSAGSDGNGERRLNLWVDTGAALALRRLARRDGVTQRAMLEALIRAADEQVLAQLDIDTPQWDEYFGCKSLRSNASQQDESRMIEAQSVHQRM